MRLLLVFTAMIAAAAAMAQPPTDGTVSGETTLADQTDIAVTVYNNDRALVRDRRNVNLPPGEQTLRFMDVAEKIMPYTVGLQSLTAPGELDILEQNYEYDLMSPSKLMEKYVGREISLVNQYKDVNFEEVKAKVLSVNEFPVYEIDGKIYLSHDGRVVLPELPEELISKPTLVWLLDNRGADHEIEATDRKSVV